MRTVADLGMRSFVFEYDGSDGGSRGKVLNVPGDSRVAAGWRHLLV